MKVAEIYFTVERVRDLDHGLWCEPCALPSAVAVEVLLTAEIGVMYAHGRYCMECRTYMGGC